MHAEEPMLLPERLPLTTNDEPTDDDDYDYDYLIQLIQEIDDPEEADADG
jgi:hypothetical protein